MEYIEFQYDRSMLLDDVVGDDGQPVVLRIHRDGSITAPYYDNLDYDVAFVAMGGNPSVYMQSIHMVDKNTLMYAVAYSGLTAENLIGYSTDVIEHMVGHINGSLKSISKYCDYVVERINEVRVASLDGMHEGFVTEFREVGRAIISRWSHRWSHIRSTDSLEIKARCLSLHADMARILQDITFHPRKEDLSEYISTWRNLSNVGFQVDETTRTVVAVATPLMEVAEEILNEKRIHRTEDDLIDWYLSQTRDRDQMVRAEVLWSLGRLFDYIGEQREE